MTGSRKYFETVAPKWDTFKFLRTEHCDRWMGFDRPDVARWFAETGLVDVKIDCVGEYCCAASQSGCGEAAVSIFVASGMKG